MTSFRPLFLAAAMSTLLLAPVVTTPAATPLSAQDDAQSGFTFLPIHEVEREMPASLFAAANQETVKKFLPDGGAPATVSTFVLKVGDEFVLFDTGNGTKAWVDGLAKLGVDPAKVSTIFITHTHGDHTGGLMDGEKARFPNATVMMAKAERDSVAMPQVPTPFYDYLYQSKTYDYGDAVLTREGVKITAIDAHGHTPGHTAFLIESPKKQMLVIGDLLHAAALQFPAPEVSGRYDQNPAVAAEARKRILNMAAEQNLLIAGMHLPKPSVGTVRKDGDGFVFTASLPAQEASWPVFRGPRGDAKSPDTGLLKSWPEGGPKLLWTADYIGHGYSGVTVADGRILTSGNVEKDGQTLAMVFCLDMNGQLLWQNDNGPALDNPRRYPSTRGTPTIDGDRVYDESAIGQISCFDVKTGEKIWTRNVTNDYGAEIPEWYLGESVVIDGNNLICTPGGPKVSAVALDKMTGKTVWEAASAHEMAGYSTPYLFDFDGMRIVLIQTEHTAEVIEAATGKTLCSFPWRNKRDTNVPMPIYRDGKLYMTSGYEFGAKLFKLTKESADKIKVDEVWYEKSFDNHHGGVILVGDYVYGSTHKGFWASIHYDSGKVGYMVRAIGSGSITFADGLIYGLAENDKTVILYKPEPEKFVELSRFELPNDATGKSWAHPVVIGGRLYIRHSQYLYCYDVKAD